MDIMETVESESCANYVGQNLLPQRTVPEMIKGVTVKVDHVVSKCRYFYYS